MNYKRILNIELPNGQSAFLWGARKTGKSTYLAEHFPQSIYYDLLKTDELTRLLVAPHLLREELSALTQAELQYPVIIDEIQKIPLLLNEIHWLIENKKIAFILSGSSARKLKRGAANLLGGRAWRYNLYPLVYKEISQFDLLTALNRGLLPSHYLSTHYARMMRAYIGDYLKEEIQAEGLVRNLPAFARFLDMAGFTNGQQLNYANIARDCAVDAKTVKEYYQILEDTLIGYLIFPFHKKVKRELISATPKFYFFDVGIANHLRRRKLSVLKGSDAGDAFEHFIFMEIIAFLGMNEIDMPIQYWRSKSGLEVDFVWNDGQVAIEVKISSSPHLADLTGLREFCKDYQSRHALVVCQAPRKRIIEIDDKLKIEVLPWQDFLENLWNKKYLES
jgi:predicted AAA+ superfamily ATPase